MHYIEQLYLIASVASIVAMAPQIKQLLVTKQSDELSIATWLTWTSYQAIALAYSLSLHLITYTVVNIAWITFYMCMLTLIIKYRMAPATRNVAYVPVTEVADTLPMNHQHTVS